MGVEASRAISKTDIDSPDQLTAAQRRMLEYIRDEFAMALEQHDYNRDGIVEEVSSRVFDQELEMHRGVDEKISLRIEPQNDPDVPCEVTECRPEIGGERVYSVNSGVVFRLDTLLVEGALHEEIRRGADEMLDRLSA